MALGIPNQSVVNAGDDKLNARRANKNKGKNIVVDPDSDRPVVIAVKLHHSATCPRCLRKHSDGTKRGGLCTRCTQRKEDELRGRKTPRDTDANGRPVWIGGKLVAPDPGRAGSGLPRYDAGQRRSGSRQPKGKAKKRRRALGAAVRNGTVRDGAELARDGDAAQSCDFHAQSATGFPGPEERVRVVDPLAEMAPMDFDRLIPALRELDELSMEELNRAISLGEMGMFSDMSVAVADPLAGCGGGRQARLVDPLEMMTMDDIRPTEPPFVFRFDTRARKGKKAKKGMKGKLAAVAASAVACSTPGHGERDGLDGEEYELVSEEDDECDAVLAVEEWDELD